MKSPATFRSLPFLFLFGQSSILMISNMNSCFTDAAGNIRAVPPHSSSSTDHADLLHDNHNEQHQEGRNLQTRSVLYGDKIHLQNYWMNNRWLTGSRGSGNKGVDVRDKLGSVYERYSVPRTYEWIVRSTSGDGRREFVDPKQGQCLKYGDKIHLQNNWMNSRWLNGSRGSGNSGVDVRNKLCTNYELVTVSKVYEWIVRSDQGDGGRTINDYDPKRGQCVKELDRVHLQNNYMDNRWLSGSRGSGNKGVITRNKLANSYERDTVKKTYEWIVRFDAGNGKV